MLRWEVVFNFFNVDDRKIAERTFEIYAATKIAAEKIGWELASLEAGQIKDADWFYFMEVK